MLTPAQRTWVVDRSNAQGQMARPGVNGFVKASWMKAMENLRKLVRRGLVELGAKPSLYEALAGCHREVKLTDEGKNCLRREQERVDALMQSL